jgi:hypothetical protein
MISTVNTPAVTTITAALTARVPSWSPVRARIWYVGIVVA